MFNSVTELQAALAGQQYISDHAPATALFLALKLRRPLFLGGRSGCRQDRGRQGAGGSARPRPDPAAMLWRAGRAHRVYEWDYARQILQVRLLEAAGHFQVETAQHALFSPAFLLKRPLLQALEMGERGAPVLLIDGLDRADEEFEAFLLEVLSDFQVTVPELGTIRAAEPPIVIITSNRTREIHDALKRRCLYHWIDYPDAEKKLAIVQARAPQAPAQLAQQVVAFVHAVREQELYKLPGVAEMLDWLAALGALDEATLSERVVTDTLGALLKTCEDIRHVQALLPQLLPTAP